MDAAQNYLEKCIRRIASSRGALESARKDPSGSEIAFMESLKHLYGIVEFLDDLKLTPNDASRLYGKFMNLSEDLAAAGFRKASSASFNLARDLYYESMIVRNGP